MTSIRISIAIIASGICFSGFLSASPPAPTGSTVIPKPAQEQSGQGAFTVTRKTTIVCDLPDHDLLKVAEYLAAQMRRATGFDLPIVDQEHKPKSNSIQLKFVRSAASDSEWYALDARRGNIVLAARKAPGLFYGVQTLLQLLPPEIYANEIQPDVKWTVPSVSMSDHPRFPWRGMHLDVCRHFFPKEFVKKYIDFLAMYKMNTFHWHLTDDQGWRIEIKKYPKLTEIGAYRNGSMIGPFSDMKFDSIRYGGFYTQEDVREIVAYAASRHITVVPEIEMPGHSLAALASYPWLSCTGGPFEVGKAWGVYDDVFCPKESTFTFLEDVLTEVCDLFPGKYIHIGGDECPKVRWKTCPHCQALIKNEGLKDEAGLQSWFIRRIERFLNGKGRQIIGWDEILEGGLAPNAAVMSWRGTEGGITAARQHHHVVMTPGSHCYFDHYQGNPKNEPLAIGGYTPVEKVYRYEPVPPALSRRERPYIMGAQGNLWTEYITTTRHVEYMALPRMAALAEVLWTPAKGRNYRNFQKRLIRHFKALDQMKVNYSRSLYEIQSDVKARSDHSGVVLLLSSPFGSRGIRYTLDGTDPQEHSLRYTGPIPITENVAVRFAYYEKGVRTGNIQTQPFIVSKSTGSSVRLKTPPNEQYYNSGAFSLVDGKQGDTRLLGRDWLGFWGPDLDAVIDLTRRQFISSVVFSMLQNEVSWIYYPKSIEVLLSDDNKTYVSAQSIAVHDTTQGGKSIEMYLGQRAARYVKVVAVNAGKIPDGKPGAGNDAWLFVDEIMVR